MYDCSSLVINFLFLVLLHLFICVCAHMCTCECLWVYKHVYAYMHVCVCACAYTMVCMKRSEDNLGDVSFHHMGLGARLSASPFTL